MRKTHSQKRRRGASVLVWSAFLLPVLLFFVGMCIDVGMIVVTDSKLQATSDLAALTGAVHLPDTDAALAAAIGVVAANDASAGAALQENDIEFGSWNPKTRTFTLDGTPTDAIRVRASRDAAHGNPLSLIFLPIIGKSAADVSDVAIGHSAPRLGGHFSGGLIGLEWADVGGTSLIDGYDVTEGPYGGDNSGLPGSVLSNGEMTVHGTPYVSGDARPGVGYTEANVKGNSEVEGTTAELTKPLDFAPVEIPGSIDAINNNNSAMTGDFKMNGGSFSQKPGDSAALPAGDYFFDDFNVKGQVQIMGPARIRVTGDWHVNSQAGVTITGGPVEFFVEGDSQLNGQGVVNLSQDPRNLVIYSTGPKITWNGDSDFYGYLYGPFEPEITINGTAEFYGGAVGRTLKISGTGDIHTENGVGFDGPSRKLPLLVD